MAIVGYFVLACALAALLLLPAFRESVLGLCARVGQHLVGAHQATRVTAHRKAQQGFYRASRTAREGSHWLRRHWVSVVFVAVLLILPPLVVFFMRGLHTLDAFDDSSVSQQGGVVSVLLQGEQLVPPPPLPPEVFTTVEVEQVRPRLASADRRWDLLDADFSQRLLRAYQIMRTEHGYEMVLIEGYRSPERQNMLASLGAHVTSAVAWQSYHQHGLAADSAFMRDGKLVISERDAWAAKGYELYGEVVQRVGLAWGGRWQNADLGHAELRKAGVNRSKAGG